MGAINRIPYGTLSLLELKQLGVNPGELGATVAPTLDLQNAYLGGKWEVTRASQVVGATNIGNYAQVTIPAGECWYVLAINAFLIYGAAGIQVRLAPLLSTGGVGIYFGNGNAQAVSAFANDSAVTTERFGQPLVLMPGTDFFTSVLYTNAGAGGFTAITNVLHCRLPI